RCLYNGLLIVLCFFFFQAEDGIRDPLVTGVQTCALPICIIALRVEVQGRSGRRVAWQLLDYYDEATGIRAMMRTTGFSLAITGLMQVDGRIGSTGVYTPDEAVPFQAYVDELRKRGVEIREVTA